jgi:hypothetical protein
MAVAPQSLANLRPWTAQDRTQRFGHAHKPRIRLSQYIRAQTNEGEELVDFMVRVMRGEHVEGLGRKPRMRERLLAIEWLALRAYGRPQEHIELDDKSLGTREERLMVIAAMSDEDRAQLKTIFTRALVARQQQQRESADSPSDSTSAAPDARP